MSANWIGFFIGLFGSVHCIGMCGPLAFAIPTFHTRWWLIVADKLLYNSGRIITYSLLGLLIGLIGKQLWLLGLQQWVSILTGILVIMAAITRLLKIRLAHNSAFSDLFKPVNKILSYALRHKAGHFIVGVLNGFLPCGFVYIALIGAVNTPSPLSAAMFMLFFGFGTFPLMLLATISSGFIGPLVRRRVNKAMPYLMICLGFWFVLRGMNLNISYLSPAKQQSGVTICK
ncbi:sulfite exporter TauE/SafE family protein [Mucilaginibacter sp. UYCu711]|uniref:sulfite exporter TauE/SafE family protein n=1 Tax=Mucilaginibacter sp. UYCu711 TaxID=3156339 RepID=UPI003D1DEDED